MPADLPVQQPCVHCGECARACPEGLDPEALFFALAAGDLAAARDARLDACSECNLCVEVCPSHIPLLDWFRWGKPELAARARADAARARFLARNARLAHERDGRAARRRNAATAALAPVQTITRAEVLAAIARGRARRRAAAIEAAVVKSQARDGRGGAPDSEIPPIAATRDVAAIRDDRNQSQAGDGHGGVPDPEPAPVVEPSHGAAIRDDRTR